MPKLLINNIYKLSVLILVITFGCSPTKKLKQGEYLVEKVEIVNVKQTKLPPEELEAFIRQKPNRKLFRKVHFFVWWYNLFDNEKIKLKKEERNAKYDKINIERSRKTDEENIKRVEKGKKPKKPKLKDKESQLTIENIRDIGEPAVLLDSTLTEQTRAQLQMFLFGKGFFNNVVTDTIKFHKDNKRVTVKYILQTKLPYTIKNINYTLNDEKLGQLILNDTLKSLLKRGANYDADVIANERQRITNFCLNNGYYFFDNAYLKFNVDSNLASHQININIELEKFSRPFSNTNDSLVLVNHTQYKIDNIYVITEQVIGKVRDVEFKDTLAVKNKSLVYLTNSNLPYRKVLISNYVDLYRNQLFRKDTAEMTYRQLIGLSIFKNVSIQFFKSKKYSNRLDCYIICNPLVKQSITTQAEGTNTSGNLGINGGILFQNKNTFRGGELLELKLNGAISAQSQLSNNSKPVVNSIEDVSDLRKIQGAFNTVQFGPEFSFSVPRAFFPFSLLPFKKEMSPRTFIKASLNYQARSEFARVINTIDYGFNFKSNKNQLRHNIIPLEVLLVRASLSDSFRINLSNLNDAFLVNSFQDHITTSTKYIIDFTSKTDPNNYKKPSIYFKIGITSAGNILRTFFNQNGRAKDSLDRYLMFGIPFAQFVKVDADYRFYIPIRKKSQIVYRVAGGIGKPLKNLNVLPYEQSFFAGGPNSIRAWRARTLGPGGYDPSNSSARFDKIGDVLLEGNMEYRFHIIKSFNGAFFADAGNIWRLEKSSDKPNGEFRVEEFWKQIAIGAGFGIRWDLSFFVLRLDLATPIKDPKYAEGDRFTYDKKPYKNIVANFGIGYPF
ncbi:MAG: outer membrane protein assembly factor [Bacteroidetes bacterium]|nr:outer membrane protein assembly factor [Bacteroidota bacterium]